MQITLVHRFRANPLYVRKQTPCLNSFPSALSWRRTSYMVGLPQNPFRTSWVTCSAVGPQTPGQQPHEDAVGPDQPRGEASRCVRCNHNTASYSGTTLLGEGRGCRLEEMTGRKTGSSLRAFFSLGTVPGLGGPLLPWNGLLPALGKAYAFPTASAGWRGHRPAQTSSFQATDWRWR